MTPPWEDPRVAEGLARQLRARLAALDDGATSIGWKVGFGAPASKDLMQITAPLTGYLTDRTLLPTGVSVPAGGWSGGVVEFEVAVYLGADLGSGTSPEQARAAVGSIGPAIELADIDLPLEPERVGDIVAGNIFHQGLVLGEPDSERAGIDTSGLTARILTDGVEVASVTELEVLTGPYPEVVATVAGTLAAHGEVLRAGDVLITGSVIPPLRLVPGSEYTFALGSFDSISVRVEA